MSKINDNRRTLGAKFEHQEKDRRELAGKQTEAPAKSATEEKVCFARNPRQEKLCQNRTYTKVWSLT